MFPYVLCYHPVMILQDLFKHITECQFFSSSRFLVFGNSTVLPVGHQVGIFVLLSLLFVNIPANVFWAGSSFFTNNSVFCLCQYFNFFCSLHKTPSFCSLFLVIITTSIFISIAQFNCLFLFSDVACSAIGFSYSATFSHPSFFNLLALTARFCAVLFDYGNSKSHLILICFLKFFPFLLSWWSISTFRLLFFIPFTVVHCTYSIVF